MSDKVYLLVYTGNCSSTIINGVKFTSSVRTANVDADKVKLFVDANGKSLYDNITITEIVKEAVLPKKEKVQEFTVDALKKANTLEQLQAMATERELSAEGSKTELAERIVEFETASKE
jgi:hypothetical protein